MLSVKHERQREEAEWPGRPEEPGAGERPDTDQRGAENDDEAGVAAERVAVLAALAGLLFGIRRDEAERAVAQVDEVPSRGLRAARSTGRVPSLDLVDAPPSTPRPGELTLTLRGLPSPFHPDGGGVGPRWPSTAVRGPGERPAGGTMAG